MTPWNSPWNSLGQNTGVGSCSLLQGIFPTQGSNSGLWHCMQILYQLGHQGSLSINSVYLYIPMCFPGGSDGKESVCNAGDLGSIPGLEQSPEEGNGNPVLYSCLENPMDRGAWQATVHGVAKRRTRLK